jgi:hypothetical protein
MTIQAGILPANRALRYLSSMLQALSRCPVAVEVQVSSKRPNRPPATNQRVTD